MTKGSIQFLKDKDYVSVAAAGATITGPTNDGFVHMSFYREVQYPIEQGIETTEIAYKGLQGSQIVEQGTPKMQVEKLLVATISIPYSGAQGMADILLRIVEFVKQSQPDQH